MWECVVCGRKNEDSVIVCPCGYDESKNYGKYFVLSPLTESEIADYEKTIQENKIGKDWIDWMDSVKEQIRDLEEEDAVYMLEQMKDSFDSLLNELKMKDELVSAFVIGAEASSGQCSDEIKKQWIEFKGRMDEGRKLTYEGNCWYFGVNRPHSYSKAVECYKKAMELKDLDAVNNLGNCYFYGKGTVKNWDKAIEYYKIASNVGHAAAVYNMGYCYQYGKGVEKDDDAAFGCYMMAAESGIKEAQRCVGNYYFSKQNMYRAVEWYEKAANGGDIEAMRSMGYCYRYGEGVRADKATALYWYQKAADLKDTLSQSIVGDLQQM